MRAGIITVIIIVVGFIPILGCDGPISETAWEKLVSKIEGALGEAQVKRTAIKQKIDDEETSIRALQGHKSGLATHAKQDREKLDDTKKDQQRLKASLHKLRELITAGEPVTLGGELHTIEQLNQKAQRLLQEFERLTSRIGGFGESVAIYTNEVEEIEDDIQSRQEQLDNLKIQLIDIDAQMTVLYSAREAAKNTKAPFIASRGDEIQRDIDELEVIISRNVATGKSPETVEDIQDDLGEHDVDLSDQTIQEIDDLLGEDDRGS